MKKISLTIISLLFIMSSAHATTTIYHSFDDLVKKANFIFTGTVVLKESFENDEGNIFTYVTFNDLDIISGVFIGSKYTLLIEGGDIGSQISGIVGMPSFEVDERLVLFVSGNGVYPIPIIGGTQGIFRIKTALDTGNKIVTDGQANRVFNIENNIVTKERRYKDEIKIISFKNNISETQKIVNPTIIKQNNLSFKTLKASFGGTPSDNMPAKLIEEHILPVKGHETDAHEVENKSASIREVTQHSGTYKAMVFEQFRTTISSQLKKHNKTHHIEKHLDKDFNGYRSEQQDADFDGFLENVYNTTPAQNQIRATSKNNSKAVSLPSSPLLLPQAEREH